MEKPIEILFGQKRSKEFSIKFYSNVIEVLDIATVNGYFIPPQVKARFERLCIKSFCSAWVKIDSY